MPGTKYKAFVRPYVCDYMCVCAFVSMSEILLISLTVVLVLLPFSVVVALDGVVW